MQALDLRHGPSTTCNSLFARFAFPDTHGVTLNGVFAAEGTNVTGVLGNLHLLHLFSEGGAISIRTSVNVDGEMGIGWFDFRHLMGREGWLNRKGLPCTIFAGHADLYTVKSAPAHQMYCC